MLELKICLVCFNADVKLYSLKEGNLRRDYNLVSGLQTLSENGLPEFLCIYCVAYIRRYIQFRERCQRTHYALKELSHRNIKIKKSHLVILDKKTLGICPQLSYIAHYSTLTEQDEFIDIAVWNNSKAEKLIKSKQQNVDFDNNLDNENNNKEQSIPTIQINTGTVETCDDDLEGPYNDDNTEIEDYNQLIEDRTDNTVTGEHNNVTVAKENNENTIDILTSNNEVDGSKLEEEYASIIPISINEAKAAMDIFRMYSMGKYKCEVCNQRYFNKERLKVHSGMHDNKHTRGKHHCTVCDYYYKTKFLLETHMTEKHMYKYVCRKCPDVNFNRASAKQHYLSFHLGKGQQKANGHERPSWLKTGMKKVKKVVMSRPVQSLKKLSEDLIIYSPIGPKEQYQLILDRKKSSNYRNSLFTCDLCYKGFLKVSTYDNHMKKHNPEYSGNLQCDVCKQYFKDFAKMYAHMVRTHVFKYSCRLCNFSCVNATRANVHYRWHKNVTYPCPHCDKVFMKMSSRLTHIRVWHPSTNICNLCGHSFVGENGLYCHKQLAHSPEEREVSAAIAVNKSDPLYCADCDVQFLNEVAFATHFDSSSKHATINRSINTGPKREMKKHYKAVKEKQGRPHPPGASTYVVNSGCILSTNCEVCGQFLRNGVEARKHYKAEHPDTDYPKRFMCDVCGHTTKQYGSLMLHMRKHTQEKPYDCPHCDKRFNWPSTVAKHLTVHTGEKRYHCQHCDRRFAQGSTLKTHIQTVHLKIPQPPWKKRNRKKRKEIDSTDAPLTTVPADNPGYPDQQYKLLEPQGDYLNAYISYNYD